MNFCWRVAFSMQKSDHSAFLLLWSVFNGSSNVPSANINCYVDQCYSNFAIAMCVGKAIVRYLQNNNHPCVIALFPFFWGEGSSRIHRLIERKKKKKKREREWERERGRERITPVWQYSSMAVAAAAAGGGLKQKCWIKQFIFRNFVMLNSVSQFNRCLLRKGHLSEREMNNSTE